MSSRQINSARLLLVFVMGLFFGLSSVMPAQAAVTSLLPNYEYDEWVCDPKDEAFNEFLEAIREKSTYESVIASCGANCSQELLGCALKTGQLKFWMIPYFVTFALEFIINVAGVLVVLMIVVGGYYYIYGAVTDDKEKGKTIIEYAIGGYALVLVSWFVVNAVLLAVTQ